MRQYETYTCALCHNQVEVQHVGGGTLMCCHQPMQCTTENLTTVNLMKAFAGESMARNKYQYFAELAQQEGYHAIARHFHEAADNERYHALAHYKMYNKLLYGEENFSTHHNLETAMSGENYEYTTMYPSFAEIAKSEGLTEIARLFTAIGKVEAEHEREYEVLKKLLEEEGFFNSENEELWVCEVCGHIHRGKKAPHACPLCKVSQEYFKREHLH